MRPYIPGMDPTIRDIYAARRRIAAVAHRTPLERSAWLSERAGADVYLKFECWQPTRSFKIRGAYNAIAALPPERRGRGLVAASAGNHGQGVALAARRLGARALIFVPRSAPETKREHIQGLGAELRLVDGIYDDAEAAARDYAERTDACFVHPFSDAPVVAGQGTIGIEILEELPEVREVVVPVGGGGLIAGVGTALEALGPGEVRVLGVQSDRTRAMHDAFEAGGPVEPEYEPTIADGLVGGIDEASYLRARAVTDEIALVAESALEDAIRGHYRHDGVVVEGGGAAPAAALIERAVELRGPAVLVLSGGNIDAERLARILADDSG